LNFLDRFSKNIHIKFHENPTSGSRVVPWGWTDITQLIVAFQNFVNATKNVKIYSADASGHQVKYFPWLPLEAALSILNVRHFS